MFLSLGTGGTGGIYYPLGGALAASLSSADPLRTYTAEVTGGSVENLFRVASGEIDLGFAISTSVEEAWTGTTGDGTVGAGAAGDRTTLRNLRIVAPLYPNLAHVLARADVEADSLAQLTGARISVGSAGSGTEQFSRHLLTAYGLDYETVDERFLSFSESSIALRDGAIDAAILSVGYPAAAVLEATTNAPVRLLPVSGEARERLVRDHPYYRPAIMPADAYPGLAEELPTVAMMNWIVGAEDLDDEVVIAVLDTLSSSLEDLVRVNEIARQIDIEALEDAPIPLHPAASTWLESREPRSGR